MQVQSNSNSTRFDLSHVDPAFGNWLAGFADGEGCFAILYQHNGDRRFYLKCVFKLSLRADDRPILVEIRDELRIGAIYDATARGNNNPLSGWSVSAKADCLRLVSFFDRFPLRAKKAHDFAVWREAVIQWNLMKRGQQNDSTYMWELRRRLMDGRSYVETETRVPFKPTFIQGELLTGVDCGDD